MYITLDIIFKIFKVNIYFRRQSTLLTFEGKYYKFRQAEDKKIRGTPIGGKDG